MRPALLLLAAACLGFPGCPGSYVVPLPADAQQIRVRTSDGWELALVRYRPPTPATGRPVLVCHGISANARSIDIDAAHSLPRWLAAHGREAWTVSLRATGDSDPIDPAKGHGSDFTFEAYWQKDLPAAIDEVRKTTGAAEIDFIGHSMGGMLLYAYLAEGGRGIHAAVTLGSPTRLDWGSAYSPLLLRSESALGPQQLPMVAAAKLTMQFHGQFDHEPVQVLLYNPENTTEQTWKRLIAAGIADIQPQVGAEFVQMVKTGSFGSMDGKIDYRHDMGNIRTPVLVVAGKADRLAVAPAVKDGYRALGGPKAWFLAGKESGAKADYGHMDLVCGDRASTELWPRVLAFLDTGT